MEKLIIYINNPFHPLNIEKYEGDQMFESFEIDFISGSPSIRQIDEIKVDWGDGNVQNIHDETKHVYVKDRFPLFYRVEIEYNEDSNFNFLNLRNNKYIKGILGPLPRVSTSLLTGYFKGCSNLEMVGHDVFKYNTDHKNISELFCGCTNLDYIDRDSKLSQKATNIDGVLMDCSKFTELPKIFNFKCVESANKSFMNMKSLIRIPMNYLEDATELKSAQSIFEGCENLREMGYNPFYNCKNLKDLSRGFAEINTTLLKVKDNFFTYIPKDCVVDDIFTN